MELNLLSVMGRFTWLRLMHREEAVLSKNRGGFIGGGEV